MTNTTKPTTHHIWKKYKVTNGKKAYVGLTSQSLTTRLSQHKKAARDLKNGITHVTNETVLRRTIDIRALFTKRFNARLLENRATRIGQRRPR